MRGTETRTIKVKAYRDSDGKPTCAIDFQAGEVCVFYRTQRMGCHETCVFAADGIKYTKGLKRRGDFGWLIPLDNCPIWNNNEGE